MKTHAQNASRGVTTIADFSLIASGNSLFQGSCVAVDSSGVCAGSGGMIADNNKGECDGEITLY